jgi:hypothetical protein
MTTKLDFSVHFWDGISPTINNKNKMFSINQLPHVVCGEAMCTALIE